MPYRLITPYFSALLIQGIAMLAMMMANLVVARRWGVEGTAVWAQSKAVVDLVTVTLVAGFPQALVYYLGKYPEMLPRLRHGAKIHSIYGFVICVVIALAGWALEIKVPGIPIGYAYIALGIAAGALVWHYLMRSVAIAVVSRFGSSWVSSLYSYLVLPLLLFFPVTQPSVITILMAVAALLSASSAHYLVYRKALNFNDSLTCSDTCNKRYGDLFGFGALMFVYTVFTFLMPIVTFAWFESLHQSKLISLFSVIIFMIAVITTPVNIIAPYWYTRWARLDVPKRSREFYGWLILLVVFGVILAVIYWFFAKEIVLLTFGEAFVSTENVVRWIGVASVMYLLSRLFAALKMSQNEMISLSIASAFRLVVTGFVMFIAFSKNTNALEVAVGGWILGEAIFIIALILLDSMRILKKADR